MFRVLIVNMLTTLERRVEKLNETFHKQIENIKKESIRVEKFKN